MTSDDTESTTENRKYPFGLSSRALFIFIVIVGLITPGLLVYLLEQANLSVLADLMWVLGYGTTVFVVWYIWIRPLDLSGSSGQEPTRTDPDKEMNKTSEDTDTDTTATAGNGQTADSREQDSDQQDAASNTE